MKTSLSELNRQFDFEWEAPPKYDAKLIEHNDNERSILGSVACQTNNIGKVKTFFYRALCYDADKKNK